MFLRNVLLSARIHLRWVGAWNRCEDVSISSPTLKRRKLLFCCSSGTRYRNITFWSTICLLTFFWNEHRLVWFSFSSQRRTGYANIMTFLLVRMSISWKHVHHGQSNSKNYVQRLSNLDKEGQSGGVTRKKSGGLVPTIYRRNARALTTYRRKTPIF